MKYRICVLWALCLATGLLVGTGGSTQAPEVSVSPDTVSINAYGNWMTVQTSIRYAEADPNAISLSGLAPDALWPDEWGRLMARFDLNGVKAIVSPPQSVLVLRGQMLDGTLYQGADTIRVRN